MKTANMNLRNFSTSNCEILDNTQLITLVGGIDIPTDIVATVESATAAAYADSSNDGTIAPDPVIWIKY